MTAKRTVALFLFVTAGCTMPVEESGSARRPIIGGFPTTTDPAIVFTSTTTGQCTGTLVSPRVVLTAAHCIYDSIENGLTSSGTVSFGTEVGNFDQSIGVTDMFAHRYYDPSVIRQFDIGLIRLSEAPEGIEPVPFNEQALDESFLGAEVRVLGFGVTDGESQTGAGTKRQVNLTIDEITGEHVGIGDAQRNICQGDSGGPTLLDIGGTERVIAVSSFGSNACMNRSYVTRTDIYADVLNQVIAAWDGPCPQDGNCQTDGCGDLPDPDCDICRFDGVCGSGCSEVDLDCPVAGFAGEDCEDDDGCESRVCVQAPDDPRVKYCSERCDPEAEEPCTPPLGSCEQGEDGEYYCHYSGSTPGVQGAPCGDDGECRSGECDERHDICIEQCGEGFPSCEEPYSCVKVGGGAKVCTFADGGCGCRLTRSGGSGAVTGALLLLGFLLLRRRRA